jgi:hypothetical protein
LKKRYILYAFTAVLIVLAVLFSQKNAESKVKFESSYKKISIVMDDNYPPFVFRDTDGKLKGILIDQWALWEKKTGIKADITAMNWNDALNGMMYKKTRPRASPLKKQLEFTGVCINILADVCRSMVTTSCEGNWRKGTSDKDVARGL